MKLFGQKGKWWWLVLAASLLGNVVFGVKSWDREKQEWRDGTVSRVIDGDTFVLGTGETIRLSGVDTPEYPDGCLGGRAKDRLEELVLGKAVELAVIGKDNFGRITAGVLIDDLDINQTLVDEGLAQAESGNYEVNLEQARLDKRGIWSRECTHETAGCEIKGNFHRGTKDRVYHLPDCYNYKTVVINPNDGDRWFCSEKEARAAGFAKSKDCPGEK